MNNETVHSILVPIYYGREQADLAVEQMKKSNKKITIVGGYFCYTQFKMPPTSRVRIRMINDLKIILVSPQYFENNISENNILYR